MLVSILLVIHYIKTTIEKKKVSSGFKVLRQKEGIKTDICIQRKGSTEMGDTRPKQRVDEKKVWQASHFRGVLQRRGLGEETIRDILTIFRCLS